MNLIHEIIHDSEVASIAMEPKPAPLLVDVALERDALPLSGLEVLIIAWFL